MTATPDRTAAGQSPVLLPCSPLPAPALPGGGTPMLPGTVVPGNKAAAPGHQLPGRDGQGRPSRPGDGRQWVIAMPAGMPLLSMNGRLHWAEQRRRGNALRDAAIVLARQQRIPRLGQVVITVEYQPPDRRRRDHDNIAALSGKHAIDGIVRAGVLPDDCPPHVAGISYRIGEIHPRGRLVLHIAETAGFP